MSSPNCGQTAESGEEYLNSMNFRALVEWITAEALLSRPEDPLAFIRLLMSEKLGQVKYYLDYAFLIHVL